MFDLQMCLVTRLKIPLVQIISGVQIKPTRNV